MNTKNVDVEAIKGDAEGGFAEAQITLGELYWMGNGVSQDYEKAFFWYKQAAEQGHTPAQNSLGVCFAKGIGVHKDYFQAFQWYGRK